jgi:hypothetical protein
MLNFMSVPPENQPQRAQRPQTFGFGNLSRQGAKVPSSDEQEKYSFALISPFSPDLCGLGVFAGDIPSFGCGYAALGPWWWINSVQ